MSRQPARDQRGSRAEVEEVGQAEGDQAQAKEHSPNAHALLADDETNTSPIPVAGEPGVEDPGARNHHRGLRGCPPRTYAELAEHRGHPEAQQAEQEPGEEQAGSEGGGALPKQSDARGEGNEGGEIRQDLAGRKTLRHRLPDRRKIAAADQAEDSQADHGQREDHVTYARDAHLAWRRTKARLVVQPAVQCEVESFFAGISSNMYGKSSTNCLFA